MLGGPNRMCQTTVFHPCFRFMLLVYMLCLKPFTWQYLTLVNIQLVLSPWAFRNAPPFAGAGCRKGKKTEDKEQMLRFALGWLWWET